MFLIVNTRVSPGLRFGSPVSPMFAPSPTLFAPVLTGAGGSPPYVTGSLSYGTFVLSTTASCSIEPALLTMKLTSPGGADAADAVNDIDPASPLVSDRVTWTIEDPLGTTVSGARMPLA